MNDGFGSSIGATALSNGIHRVFRGADIQYPAGGKGAMARDIDVLVAAEKRTGNKRIGRIGYSHRMKPGVIDDNVINECIG
jgi:hypothetical protein